MAKLSAPEARRSFKYGDPFEDGDEAAADHAEVIFADSRSSKEEERALGDLLDQDRSRSCGASARSLRRSITVTVSRIGR